MPSDLACCRECGSTNLILFPVSTHTADGIYTHTYAYHCRGCGHTTPERDQAHAAAQDVDWVPAHEVRFR